IKTLMGGKDHLGGGGGKAAAVLGLAGLDDDRMPLRRARNVQRPPDLEMFALMISEMHLIDVKEHPGFLVADKGVVLETVPKFLDHIDEFRRPAIAPCMWVLVVKAKVMR